MANIISVKTYVYDAPPGATETEGCIYELTVRLQGEEINPESIIEEVRAWLAKWAITWLRQDCAISMKQKGHEGG